MLQVSGVRGMCVTRQYVIVQIEALHKSLLPSLFIIVNFVIFLSLSLSKDDEEILWRICYDAVSYSSRRCYIMIIIAYYYYYYYEYSDDDN